MTTAPLQQPLPDLTLGAGLIDTTGKPLQTSDEPTRAA